VSALDISNHQSNSYKALIDQLNPDHVIVRIPQHAEPQSLWDIAYEQTAHVLSVGKSLGGYGWLYRDEPIDDQVADWYEFLATAGVTVPVLWIDIEPYQTNSNLPSTEQIKQCIELVRRGGISPGIYTGPWVWSLLRNPIDPVINACPLWTAEYNGLATLSDVTLYGGWTVAVGHQWTSSPLDQSVFDSVYTLL
jgi:hypothetical protein